MYYVYPALFTEDVSGGYNVQFVDFENGYTCGDDIADAAVMASEVLWLLIDDYLQLDKPLPKPTYAKPDEGMLVAISIEVDTERGMLTTRMAAGMLGVSTARVRQMIGTGQLAAKKKGRDNYVYLWSVKERLANPRSAGRPRSKGVVADKVEA
ncbi:MAG: type II toxin-antitoxin system HicB family antitoxin [Gordonibacter sp.]|uniref:type II toxin-antitoxin system HicB family antitoxin n=1 Tax=Gordonibacter sp. TaxID=1968902 RepID=UPI002FCB3918